MKDLSMHIMDIVQNSVRAQAANITLTITVEASWLILAVCDDGTGMDEATLARVSDPFYTSRSTRKVGMGLPLIKQTAEQTGGSLQLESAIGKGTTVTARLGRRHIDRPPMGNIAATAAMMITGNEGVNLVFEVKQDDAVFSISTREVKDVLGDVDIRLASVTSFLKDMIRENLEKLNIEFD